MKATHDSDIDCVLFDALGHSIIANQEECRRERVSHPISQLDAHVCPTRKSGRELQIRVYRDTEPGKRFRG